MVAPGAVILVFGCWCSPWWCEGNRAGRTIRRSRVMIIKITIMIVISKHLFGLE